MYNDENTREVVKLLDPQPGEMILDVGCGEWAKRERVLACLPDTAKGRGSCRRGYTASSAQARTPSRATEAAW